MIKNSIKFSFLASNKKGIPTLAEIQFKISIIEKSSMYSLKKEEFLILKVNYENKFKTIL